MGGGKKVLVLTPDVAGPGGVSHYFRTLALTDVEGLEYFFVNRNVAESPLARIARLATNYAKFLGRLVAGDVDLIHVNPSFDRKSFFRDAAFCGLAQAFGKPTVVFFRGWDERYEQIVSNSAWRRAIAQWTFGRCGNYIVLGRTFEDRLRRLGMGGRFWRETTVAGAEPDPPVDPNEKMAELGRHTTILFMSRVLRAKGIYLAMDAVARLRERHPGQAISLIVAGDGEERAPAMAYAASRGWSFVSFVGEVRGADKDRVFRNAHVLLFPTFHGEGMPNVVLEAMLYGLPVICRDAGAIRDVVVDGINGYVTSSRCPDVFADLLGTFLADIQAYREVSARNARAARGRYDCAAVRQRLLGIYGEVLVETQPDYGSAGKKG